jgi:hypothetical protein
MWAFLAKAGQKWGNGSKNGVGTSLQPTTLNPQLSTLNTQPSTLNPQLSALNRENSTLNPQPLTLHPQPSTLRETDKIKKLSQVFEQV